MRSAIRITIGNCVVALGILFAAAHAWAAEPPFPPPPAAPPGWTQDPATGQWLFTTPAPPPPSAPPGWTRDPVTGQWLPTTPAIPAFPPPAPDGAPTAPPRPVPLVFTPPSASIPPPVNARGTRPFFLDFELPLVDAPLLVLVPKDELAYSVGLAFRGNAGAMFPNSRFGLGLGGSIHVGLRDSLKLRDYHVDLVLRKNDPGSITNVGVGIGIKALVGADGFTYGVLGFHASFDGLLFFVRGVGMAVGMDLGAYSNNGVSTLLLGLHLGAGVAVDRWANAR